MAQKILVLGGSGYIGSLVVNHLQICGMQVESVSRNQCDYTSISELKKLIQSKTPDYLVNCAGFTGKPNVDTCESRKLETLSGNAILPGTIMQACAEFQLRWGHVSSGCIYSGMRPDGTGFTEEDPPNFCFRSTKCSFYSGSKAMGEELISDAENCHIWRIRIPFNSQPGTRNYLSKLLSYERLLEAENSITFLDDFMRVIEDCIQDEIPAGLYNVTNPGSITTSLITRMISESGISSRIFCYFENEAEFMSSGVLTPRSNCILNSSKILAYGARLQPVTIAIEKALANWPSTK